MIVGGGPAGASAGIHLALGGAHVLLAEQKKFPRAKLCGEFISPECLAHFERLGVLDSMTGTGGARVSETIFYSRSGQRVNVPSEWFGENRLQALGLSRAEMDARLLERARDAGVEVLEETQGAGLLMTEEGGVRGVRLKTKDVAREFSSLITIDATGRARTLARRIEKIKGTERRRAKLVAFKAHLENARGEAGHCEIYFYRGGYGGLSQVENGLSNLCFIASARDVRALRGDAERVMREIVCTNARARETLRHARARTEWLSVALDGFGRRELVPADGLLTVGDAASFIDPFTGSGMLMALESGELAAQVIVHHLGELRAGSESFHSLAEDYRTLYDEKFARRLRISSWLRRAAFVPRLAEAAILAFGLNAGARKRLARATRQKGKMMKSASG